MSDNDLSDGMEELQILIAEYEAKGKQKTGDDVAPKIVAKTETLPPKTEKKANVETPMDKVLFGDKAGLLQNLANAVGEAIEEESEKSGDEKKSLRKSKKRKPAWTDADDEIIKLGEVKRETKYSGPLDHLRKDKSYKEYLTSRFTNIVAQPKWASLDRDKGKGKEGSDDEELLHTVGFLAKPPASSLPSKHIQCKRLKDLNRATYVEGAITSIQFHPTSTAAMVAGESGIATIYSIDGMKNERLHSMRFENFPIKCAKIMPCGTRAIFGSIRRFYYSYDLLTAQETRHVLPQEITTLRNFQISPCGRYMAVAGRFGNLHLFDAKSQELIHSFKQEDPVRGIRFTTDSNRLICTSASNYVNIFSLSTQRLEHSFIDDGCVKGSVLDIAPNKRLLATGSMEGAVNVYDLDKVFSSKAPMPEKTFLNLTTAISDVKFNHSSEILGMSSDEVASAIKLAQFPSATVFANFPGVKSEIGKVRIVEFSPASGYLALGNRHKEVTLFRLKHFKNY